jgi:hypothetical protein
MAEESACHFAAQRLDQVEPGTVGGSANVFEAIGSCGQKARVSLEMWAD